MSVEAATGGSPDSGGRTHGVQRRGARAGSLLPATSAAARRPPVHRAPPTRVLFDCAHRRHCFSQRSMLQQMSSPPSAYVAGEVATIVRQLEGRACGDVSWEASSDAAEDTELPQCKIRRNYNCTKCTFFTQNPRAYVVHTRDAHFVKLKIFDCPYCIYASRYRQKLIRHLKTVHSRSKMSTVKLDPESSPPSDNIEVEQSERMEDLLEEVEDCDDIMELDEDDLPDRSDDVTEQSDTMNIERGAPSASSKAKGKYFSCEKCNYVTHIRARFTKHVKYHSMPMIKCTICDFRTPYKWNLDRHMKNHGGSGSFNCSMCNFTADIRQSLTVHEMNHHTPTVGHTPASRRRNRVGASDTVLADSDLSALLNKKEEACSDSRSSHSVSDMGLQYAERELISCKSDSNDASSSEFTKDTSPMAPDMNNQHSPNHNTDETKSQKQSRKIPRPIPPLIPLNSSTPNQKTSSGEPPNKKFKESHNEVIDFNSGSNIIENLSDDITIIPISNTAPKEIINRKKNESFFDRLKERLLTETGEEGSLKCKNCGFESKCLSEHSVHEKTCFPQANRVQTNASISSSGSTRCQNCRHRCKSSADLYVHMQSCGKPNKSGRENTSLTIGQDSNTEITKTSEKDTEPHPMENVVFVWNNINQDSEKFDMPLGVNINDDRTMPEVTRSFETELADDNDTMNMSPSQAVGRKVFKCPHCPFFSTTASRFHVHIVGHLNKKPFECSLCKYKSNWRWDITKHIKLKSARDPEHNDAKVLMTDETGRRNYSKYNKFLAMPIPNENGENEFQYLDPNTLLDSSMDIDESYHDNTSDVINVQFETPLNLQTQLNDNKFDLIDNNSLDMKKPKKTLWKCKKCNYRDPSKEALLEHVREHSRQDGCQEDGNKSQAKKPENAPDPADLAYRCGHCNQLSNWKHVIQRHCRLKHEGIIKVITTLKPKPDIGMNLNDITTDMCNKCPFRSSDKEQLIAHLQQHQPSPESIFKCYFCPFFVKNESELVQHLLVHGITDPEEYIANAMGKLSPTPEHQGTSSSTSSSTKRHKCTECPYETNSKSQYMYHEQFHRLPADTPYKCPECNYSVSKRHLLHQHLRVHGIVGKKSESEAELEAASGSQHKDGNLNFNINLDEIPYVWVSAKNEFHKMFKCRYCSYVNSQKCKIPNHEKIHCIVSENNDTIIYKCLECKLTCDHPGRLAEHSKFHGEIYGRIYCPVEDDVPDEEQISKLRKVIEMDKLNMEMGEYIENREVKLLYFCHKCPARFHEEVELQAHEKQHSSTYINKCTICEFTAPEENELEAHVFVHTDEYNTKTKILKFIHKTHPLHTQPVLEMSQFPSSSEVMWIVGNPNKVENMEKTQRQYSCKQCPAKFFKSSRYKYHLGLHGGEGDYKCPDCNYTVRNIQNLAKHKLLHENDNKTTNCDYESGDDMDFKNIPLSGTDLFQRKTEAQKRVLIDKDKLVKPNDHFPPVLQADPQFGFLMHGNPEFIYPTYLKNGRQKEKRYKCHKCPSAFEKREQYKIHLSLHGSKQRYKCELCDYSVKYYANYVQHMRKHQMNDEAQAERKKDNSGYVESENQDVKQENTDNIKLAIKTMPKGIPKSDFQQFSISDQQTLKLLQRGRSMNCIGNDAVPETSPTKERKILKCLMCPYTNQRQDSLNNHYKRHGEPDIHSGGSHECSFCDLVVVQSHFLREHLKTHFNFHKTLVPECFVANEDVTFTITKLDKDSVPIDLKLDVNNKALTCNDDKIYVKIKTGEVVLD